MLPDITAGLMALAAPLPLAGPPGAAIVGKPAEPPASGMLSAALFASFLTQSSSPDLTAAPTAAVPTVKHEIVTGLNAKRLTSETLETMDTLPTLSFPSTETKAKPSELPSQSIPVHKPEHKADDDKAASALPDASVNSLNAAPIAVLSPIAVPVQAALLPVLTPSALNAAAPLPASNALSVSVGQIQPQTETLNAPMPAAVPSAPPVLSPAPPVLLSSPQTVGQAASPVASALEPPKTAAGLPLAASFRAVPQIVRAANPLPPPGPTQAAPLPLVTAALGPVVPSTASAAAVSVLVQPAIVPAPLPLGPAKSPGKFIPTALKPAAVNADTNTRIDTESLLAEAPTIAAKTAVSAKLPEPSFGSQSIAPAKALEAKAPELEKALEPSTPLTAQVPGFAAPVAGLGSRPLSAADQAKIVHQVAEGVGAMPLPTRPGGVQQMSLQLHPKDWGSLQVSVSVTAGPQTGSAKTVTAHIVAETPQVKAALQSQTGALHQALRASGLNLSHLTVSVKPPEVKPLDAKLPEIKPAGQSASAGLSSGQGQSTNSGQTNSGQSGTPAQSADTQLGTSAGGSQHGRQEQPPPAAAQAEPEPEEAPVARLPIRPASGRIDTRA